MLLLPNPAKQPPAEEATETVGGCQQGSRRGPPRGGRGPERQGRRRSSSARQPDTAARTAGAPGADGPHQAGRQQAEQQQQQQATQQGAAAAEPPLLDLEDYGLVKVCATHEACGRSIAVRSITIPTELGRIRTHLQFHTRFVCAPLPLLAAADVWGVAGGKTWKPCTTDFSF